MKKAIQLSLIIVFLLLTNSIVSQNILFEETFDVDPLIGNGFTWTHNGTGEGGTYWGDREPIFSESGGGAFIANGDSIIESGETSVNAFFDVFSDNPALQNNSRFFLKFNQYYRNFQSNAGILAFTDVGAQQIFSNDGVGQNAETSFKDVVVIEITDFISSEGVILQFHFTGNYYFWIIDDIQIIEDQNPYPPETIWGNLPGEGDFDGGLNGWTTTGISDPNAVWVWEADGKADLGAFADGFGDLSIVSPTLSNGAMVFDSDYYDNGGVPGNEGMGPAPSTQLGELISPIIDLSMIPQGDLILNFNQYFRQDSSVTSVAYSFDGGSSWLDTIDVNPFFPPDTITTRTDLRTVVLPSIPSTPLFRFKFIYEANYFFWVIDDVILGKNTLYPETFPPYIGDSLINFGIPYDVDCDKGPFKPNQVIVQFKPNTSDMDKQMLRDSFNVAHVDSCMCSVIELWHFGPDTSSSMGLSANGPQVGILEKKGSIGSAPEVDGSDLNRFVWNELDGNPPPVFTPLETIPSIPQTPFNTLIALLDTGVDFDHPAINSKIYVNTNEVIDSMDEDGSCYPDDVVGWNFVKDNNNVRDDHSHGTHLSGIMNNNIQMSSTCTDFKILPLKTHDEHGVAELFDIQCAFYYALRQGADVINCSWGWYDNDSEILNNMLDSARMEYNALAIAAAGNDTIDLNDHPQFPACTGKDNILSIASISSTGELSEFSNVSPLCLDMAAIGDSVMSILPGDQMGFKSGTSMAAPAVAAAAALIYCQDDQVSYNQVRDCLLDNASQDPSLGNVVLNGNVLSFNLSCITSVPNLFENTINLSAFPNPTSGRSNLVSDSNLQTSELKIYDSLGRLIVGFPLRDVLAGDHIEIDLSGYSPGIYLVSISLGTEVVTKKILKE